MKWADDLGLPRWVQCNHKGRSLQGETRRRWDDESRGEGGRERMIILENVTLLNLQMDEGVMSQGMQEACSFWKRQGRGFPS